MWQTVNPLQQKAQKQSLSKPPLSGMPSRSRSRQRVGASGIAMTYWMPRGSIRWQVKSGC